MRNISVTIRLAVLGGAALAAALLMMFHTREASAESAGCHFAPMAGIVGDSATHLNWQQASSGALYNWDDAARYCATLELHGMGWRLPTIKELQTLVDEGAAMPATDSVAFPNTESEYYWTSSQVVSFANEAWAVSFAYGFDAFFDVHSEHRVRCVR